MFQLFVETILDVNVHTVVLSFQYIQKAEDAYKLLTEGKVGKGVTRIVTKLYI